MYFPPLRVFTSVIVTGLLVVPLESLTPCTVPTSVSFMATLLPASTRPLIVCTFVKSVPFRSSPRRTPMHGAVVSLGVHRSLHGLHVGEVGTIQVRSPMHPHGTVVTLGVHRSLHGLHVGEVGTIQVSAPMHAHGAVVTAGDHRSLPGLHVSEVGTSHVQSPMHAHGAMDTPGVHRSLQSLHVGEVGTIHV